MIDHKEHNLLINIKDLTRWYPDSPYLLLNQFSLALYKNDFTILVGKSGTGKSTLVKFLTGQLPAPARTIYHKMEDMSKYSESDIQLYRRKLGVVTQHDTLLPHLSVKENVVYPLRLYDTSEAVIDTKFEKIKIELWLESILDLPIHVLSAGEKQKVAFARALIHDPEVIIADEPAGNLDRESTQKIADMLIRANKEWNTVLLMTHDIHFLNYIKSAHPVSLYTL